MCLARGLRQTWLPMVVVAAAAAGLSQRSSPASGTSVVLRSGHQRAELVRRHAASSVCQAQPGIGVA